MRRSVDFTYHTETDPAKLLLHLSAIRAIADAEKEALGFLPEAAYQEAIISGRLIAMLRTDLSTASVVGFVLYGGVFPHAKVQQLGVLAEYRKAGIATALINNLVSKLEKQGFLTIGAAVASDLPAAQAFYERNGFVAHHSKPGGQARNRTIVVRSRDLATESLLTLLEPSPVSERQTVDLGLKLRGAGPAPLYAIDLNVLFDVIKEPHRPRYKNAARLIAAALGHQIRLAIAQELVVELERNSSDRLKDPLLALARQLPRLPTYPSQERDALANIIHDIVFTQRGLSEANTPQSRSDSRHLAEAAIARASGYVTSDGRILAARDQLFHKIGIDVASLAEFDALIPTESQPTDQAELANANWSVRTASINQIREYLRSHYVDQTISREFAPSNGADHWHGRAVIEGTEIVSIAVQILPSTITAPARMLVHVRPDHVKCDTFAEHLIKVCCNDACHSVPIAIELPCIPGQSVVRRMALLSGFLPVSHGQTLIKVALGRPITQRTWPGLARITRRKTGLQLPETPPTVRDVSVGIQVETPNGTAKVVGLAALEEAISPTIIVWPGRDGAIVPIARGYADDLLGTNEQLLLFNNAEAAFLSRRTYFSSPRTAGLLRPGLPILFYESSRSGGRGAIVAAARILDTTVVNKDGVSDELFRRAVVEDLRTISSSDDVLATTFDGLLRFPKPVPLSELRNLGAASNVNFQTTTAVTAERLASILERGWSDA